uniref:Uncharacterized protein n=1 Tax=Arion vulgaris TaxID=1028688 RepID=A0A0B6ZK38_9EUPU
MHKTRFEEERKSPDQHEWKSFGSVYVPLSYYFSLCIIFLQGVQKCQPLTGISMIQQLNCQVHATLIF